MSRNGELRRDFQRKDCRVTVSAVIVVSNLFGIAAYRQNIVADRAALPVSGLFYIESGRQRGKMKSAVDRSDRIGVVICVQIGRIGQIGILTEIQTGQVVVAYVQFGQTGILSEIQTGQVVVTYVQFGQLGIPAEIKTGELGADTEQSFQLREIADTGKISDVLIVYIKLPRQRDFPCAEFAVPVSVKIFLRAEKNLPECRVGEMSLVDGNVRAASRNRERENDVFLLSIQFRPVIFEVIGIGHDSGIVIHGKDVSADRAAGQLGHSARIKEDGQSQQIKGIAFQRDLANVARCIQINQLGVASEIELGQRVIRAVHILQLRIMTEIELGQLVFGADHHLQLRIIAEIQCRQAIGTAIQLFQLGIPAEIERG